MKAALVLLAATLAAAQAGAHEIGRTQVTAAIRADGMYRVDIAVDPDALLTRLEVYGGGHVSTSPGRNERDARIAQLAGVFLERVRVKFDGVAERPAFQYLPASAVNDFVQAPSTIRLTGAVPLGARAFTFEYGLAMGSFALNVRIGDGPIQTFWLEGPQASAPILLMAVPAPPTWIQIAERYFGLGYTHILPKGLDHILFVVGIFLLSSRWRSVLLQVSTFTIAHSITLGLTMYGIVALPARIVEPMIALSIAYVAVENLFTSELKSWRLALVFSFGLLHGMGFAGVLRELGLPRSQFLTALLTFNVGVEAGQLTVIALAAAAVAYWRSQHVAYRRFIVQPASIAIAIAGVYWTIQRLIGA